MIKRWYWKVYNDDFSKEDIIGFYQSQVNNLIMDKAVLTSKLINRDKKIKELSGALTDSNKLDEPVEEKSKKPTTAKRAAQPKKGDK